MKNIILIIVILSTSFSLTAQSNIRYDTCNELSKFAGEWRYANGLDTIKIFLKVHRTFDMEDGQITHIMDRLRGWHEYKIGNIIIESNYQHRFDILPTIYNVNATSHPVDNTSIFLAINRMHCTCDIYARKLYGEMKDLSQIRESHDAYLTVSNDLLTMTWRQGRANWYGAWSGAFGMTLPQNFTLIKQII